MWYFKYGIECCPYRYTATVLLLWEYLAKSNHNRYWLALVTVFSSSLFFSYKFKNSKNSRCCLLKIKIFCVAFLSINTCLVLKFHLLYKYQRNKLDIYLFWEYQDPALKIALKCKDFYQRTGCRKWSYFYCTFIHCLQFKLFLHIIVVMATPFLSKKWNVQGKNKWHLRRWHDKWKPCILKKWNVQERK